MAAPHNRRARGNAEAGGTGPTPGTASPSSVLPRGTGRLGSGENGRQSMPTGSDNFLDLKNRVQHKLIAELDPKLDLTQHR